MSEPDGTTVRFGAMSRPEDARRGWTFLTNHAHTLLVIARDPGVRIQDIALRVGITLRAAQSIVGDLAEAGYITRTRVGRRNRYAVDAAAPFRHPLEDGHQIGELLEALGALRPPESTERSPR